MTREELIEKVAISIHETMWANVDFDRLHGQQKKHLRKEAEIAVNTIFAALKEPTEEMIDAYFNNSLAATTMAGICANDWQSMLAASPLAPEEKK